MRYFEDLEPGDAHEFGTVSPTREEIVSFAERYDPQRFHVDAEAAAESIYGGIIASGWHTVCLAMRLWVEEFLDGTASMGARGVDELRWRRPVYPGDTLAVSGEVLDRRASESSDDRGYVDYELTVENGDGEVVCSMVSLLVVGRAPADYSGA